MRVIAPAALAALIATAASAADQPRLHIFGPKGCAFFDGLGGDGAAFHALDDAHLILDHGALEGTVISCQFDGEFSLIGAPGKTEAQSGSCTNANGETREGDFTLTYSDADNATLNISGFDQTVPFVACDRP
ncbi:hypothetical protein [Roseovarius indicus]|uniref:Uncharacterized protein n=1 Tax=Roseovarius indicus TaxID=540747 RepID=A0A0T5P448_9RHOB|nr:hypothetical protein [Roseovarius indicus]KRS16041.1 hypothetical protein XM52_20985 [Roseovarius indicus]QEW28045.1 hypothetical protein RIdsm_03870 [Roseovarius indicus]SFE60457.1 hypothetical protein SAMN04488031_113119 [Roseovarius indicus]